MPMRQLRTCDFCGADAAGVYEVLPPELSPTEAEQRRVVLCPDCLETLEGVLDPLLARLGVGDDPNQPTTARPAADAAPSAAENAADTDEPPADRETVSADGSDRGETVSADGSDGGETVSADGSDGDVEEAADVDTDPVDGDTGDTDAETDTTAPTDEAVSWDEVDSPTPLGADEAEPSLPDAASNGTADATTSDSAELDSSTTPSEPDSATVPSESDPSTTPSESEPASTSPPAEEPAEFRTVMRLLGNREFPVERSEIVELAAGAYDLEEPHVERILAYAVDRGVLVEDGGTLRKS
ncbi:hypothetical protein DVK02_09590 [Halobellus sp. Atlit-31R]|nr:hypothetical protein DVK02_09590 [Halobellus sp. Atlit-31R]